MKMRNNLVLILIFLICPNILLAQKRNANDADCKTVYVGWVNIHHKGCVDIYSYYNDCIGKDTIAQGYLSTHDIKYIAKPIDLISSNPSLNAFKDSSYKAESYKFYSEGLFLNGIKNGKYAEKYTLAIYNSFNSLKDTLTISKEINYTMGIIDGEYLIRSINNSKFKINDSTLYKTMFINGTGYFKDYDRYGVIIAEGAYKNGCKSGIWKFYNEWKNIEAYSLKAPNSQKLIKKVLYRNGEALWTKEMHQAK